MQKTKSEAQKSLELVKSREVDLSELAGASDSPGMQIAVAFGQAMRTNPQIALCTAESKMAAIYKVAALNMDCSGTTGEVWLVPINETQPDKTKVLKLNVWVGVAGMLKLARRSGMVASVNCAAVREGDVFRYVPTDATTPLYHEPRSGTAKVIAFWAQVVLTSGAKETAVVWEDEFDALVAAGQAHDRRAQPAHAALSALTFASKDCFALSQCSLASDSHSAALTIARSTSGVPVTGIRIVPRPCAPASVARLLSAYCLCPCVCNSGFCRLRFCLRCGKGQAQRRTRQSA